MVAYIRTLWSRGCCTREVVCVCVGGGGTQSAGVDLVVGEGAKLSHITKERDSEKETGFQRSFP